MRKPTRLPREGATSDDGLSTNHDLPFGAGPTDQDVEGHTRLPGTGGDLSPRMPGTGGERSRLPGTGGDFRRPSGGGEATDDDIEGHL